MGWDRLPGHTDTAVQLKVGQLERRKQRRIERTLIMLLSRWRPSVVSALLILTVFGGIVGSVLTVSRDAFNDSSKPPSVSAPSKVVIEDSIHQGQDFVAALYKSLDNGQAVQSEASGVPFRAYFEKEKVWVLLGQDQSPWTSISNEVDTATTQSYDIGFDSPAAADALTAHVKINWAFSATRYQISIAPQKVNEPVQLWLDRAWRTTFDPGPGINLPLSLTFPKDDESLARMNRFTVRHATQEAFLYWSTYGKEVPGASQRAAALGKFLAANGYQPGFDLRAPMFNYGVASLPDDMPVNPAAYPDCKHIAAGNQYAYAYHSRVCLFVNEYLVSGERDPFLQAWAALTVLMKYHDTNHSLPESHWWLQGGTPKEVAHHLEGQWGRSEQGVPKCTPFSCNEESSIRTSAFGALEAQLGYCYGIPEAQKFADAAAATIIRTQIGPDGLIVAANGTTYYRPMQAGSYLDAWSKDYKFVNPTTPKLPLAVALTVKDAHLTPLEADGIIASNSETTFDALAFLQMYEGVKYKHACTA